MAEIAHYVLGDARKVPGRRFLPQEKGGRKAQVGSASVLNTLLHCWPMDDAGVRDRLKFAIERLTLVFGICEWPERTSRLTLSTLPAPSLIYHDLHEQEYKLEKP